MTQDEFIDYLMVLVARVGSQVKLARQLSISATVVNDTLTRRFPPPPKLLAALGFTRIIMYIPPNVPEDFIVDK